MEERAGVVLPPTPAERDRPRLDPPNVLWFTGAYALALASYGLLEALPDSHSSLWIFLAAVGFLLGYSALSWYLLQEQWWVPGGLAAALAVALFPAVCIAFLRLVDVSSTGLPRTDFNPYAVGVAIATALAGVAAYFLTRFAFLFFTVVAALIVAAQFLAAAGNGAPTFSDRATAALVVGGLLVIAGVFTDAFGARRAAFWFHVGGWFSVGAGLVLFIVDGGDPERGWVPILIAGALLVVVSGPIRRASWAVYGVLGYYAALVHYLVKGLDERRWPFALALLAVGLSLFVTGMLQHRFGKAWGRYFVRRPPPSIDPSP